MIMIHVVSPQFATDECRDHAELTKLADDIIGATLPRIDAVRSLGYFVTQLAPLEMPNVAPDCGIYRFEFHLSTKPAPLHIRGFVKQSEYQGEHFYGMTLGFKIVIDRVATWIRETQPQEEPAALTPKDAANILT